MISQHNAINFWQSIRRVMVALFAVSILFGTLGAAPAKDAKKDSKSTKTTTRNAWWGGQIEVAEGWWETSSKDKQGGFIGAELGLGETSVYLQGGYSGTGISPNINIFGGYQWYFTDYPYFHLGLRLRGHLGYSYHGADVSYYSWSTPHSVSAHSLQGGVEPAFIWDFLDYKKHTLGWYFSPIGFEIAGFFGSVTPSGSAESIDLTSYTKFIWLVSSGVHYYYNNKHLVFLGYRYRKVFGGYSQSTSTTLGFVVQPWHSFVVGYAYKF